MIKKNTKNRTLIRFMAQLTFGLKHRTGPEKTTSGLVKKPKQRFGKMRFNFLSSFDKESVKNIFYISDFHQKSYFRSHFRSLY